MAMVMVAIDLPYPVSAVWDELSKLERHSDWMMDAEGIVFATEQRRGVGTEMRVRTRVGPFVTQDVIEVREWTEARSIGVSHRGLVTGVGVFVLTPIDTGTRFVWWEDLEFPWYLGGAITAWFAAPVLKWIWRGNLNRFAMTLA
jgi:uncharacterized protein YndB with AHSA1/START domain